MNSKDPNQPNLIPAERARRRWHAVFGNRATRDDIVAVQKVYEENKNKLSIDYELFLPLRDPGPFRPRDKQVVQFLLSNMEGDIDFDTLLARYLADENSEATRWILTHYKERIEDFFRYGAGRSGSNCPLYAQAAKDLYGIELDCTPGQDTVRTRPSAIVNASLSDLQLESAYETFLYRRQRTLANDLAQRLETLRPFRQQPWGPAFYPDYGYRDVIGSQLSYYTDALAFRGINRLLREPHLIDELDIDNFLRARIMALLFRNGVKMPVTARFFRGVHTSQTPTLSNDAWQPGREVVFREFLSASPSLQHASSFVKGRGILFVLDVPIGSPLYIIYLNAKHGEPEVIVPNCTKWIVDEIRQDQAKSGQLIVFMHQTGIGKFGFPSAPNASGVTNKGWPGWLGGKGSNTVGSSVEGLQNAQVEALASYISDFCLMDAASMNSDLKPAQDNMVERIEKEFLTYKASANACTEFGIPDAQGVESTLLTQIQAELAAKVALEQAAAQKADVPAVAVLSADDGTVQNPGELAATALPESIVPSALIVPPAPIVLSVPTAPPPASREPQKATPETIVQADKKAVDNIIKDLATDVQQEVKSTIAKGATAVAAALIAPEKTLDAKDMQVAEGLQLVALISTPEVAKPRQQTSILKKVATKIAAAPASFVGKVTSMLPGNVQTEIQSVVAKGPAEIHKELVAQPKTENEVQVKKGLELVAKAAGLQPGSQQQEQRQLQQPVQQQFYPSQPTQKQWQQSQQLKTMPSTFPPELIPYLSAKMYGTPRKKQIFRRSRSRSRSGPRARPRRRSRSQASSRARKTATKVPRRRSASRSRSRSRSRNHATYRRRSVVRRKGSSRRK